MVRKTKTKPKIIIDTREKTPWCFDGDEAFEEVIVRKLDAGDYSLDGLEEIVTIERKASADEMLNNFMKNKERIYAEIDRMKDYPYKFIIIEQDLATLMDPKSYYINRLKNRRKRPPSPRMPIAIVISNLTTVMLEHGVHVIFAGSKAQNMARGILLAVHELHRKGLIKE
jgi:ERCC4-type nuclease